MRPCLYTARWVLPVTAPPIPRGAVLVDGAGIIRQVGTAAALEPQATGDDLLRVHLGDAVLLPGLVNVHTHPELAGMRGLLEDLPFHRWIPALRRAKDGAPLGPEDFDVAARWACLEAMAAGITTLGATEDSGAALGALREAGMRGVVYREVFAPDPAAAPDALRSLQEKLTAMRAGETELVRVGASPHAPYTVSDDLFRSVAAWARAEGLPLATHAAEAEAELLLVRDGAGPFAAGLRGRGIQTPPRAPSTIRLLEQTGVLGEGTLLIHCVLADQADIRRIADAGAAVAHCPVANARLGHGVAPVAAMQEAGINVGLGTDSVASNNRVDLLEEARAAQLLQRASLQAPAALGLDRLLRLATLDGATALGLDARIGSLEPGKDADLCAVALRGLHVHPVIDPVASLFMSARGSDVVLTAVQGRVIFRDGRSRTLDPEPLRGRMADMALRLQGARDA
jgi:cytosine/adenosine deaminase-related metal-dependent hydrolase